MKGANIMKKISICGLGNEYLYKLTDKEVNQLKAIKNCVNNDYLRFVDGQLYIIGNKVGKNKEINKDKKEIIDAYKRQLDILSEVQDDLSIAFQADKIDVNEFMQSICDTNDRIMTIIEQLKVESEYIPF